jgi:hypothetical protein
VKRKTLIALIIAIPLGSGYAARGHAQDLGTIYACSLLSQEEISAAVGVPMNAGRDDNPEHHQKCSWQPPFHQPGHPPSSIARVELFVEPANGFGWDLLSVSEEYVTSISGLGEDAYYIEHPHMMMTLNVKKGDLCLIVTWIGIIDPQKVMDSERTIAAQVLSRL